MVSWVHGCLEGFGWVCRDGGGVGYGRVDVFWFVGCVVRDRRVLDDDGGVVDAFVVSVFGGGVLVDCVVGVGVVDFVWF